MPPGPSLAVLVDGAPLPDEQARALWKRFSDWMEKHAGDLAGFAKAEGFASVHPELHAGGPVLVASHTAAQRPYAAAEKPNRGRAKRKTKDS
jgi:hypothetical protein